MRFAALFLSLLLASGTQTEDVQPPLKPVQFQSLARAALEPLITGPSEVEPGAILTLSAKGAKPESWQVAKLPGGETVKHITFDAGETIALPTPAGASYVVFAAVMVDAVKQRTAVVIVKVTGAGPQPEPDPPRPPPLPPDDTLPPGPHGLTRLARDWSVAHVGVQTRSVNAQALAKSFRSVASAIAAGALKEPQAILTATRDANNAALGTDLPAWKKPFFEDRLTPKLEELWTANLLRTPEQYAEAWRGIAAGLEAVK